MGTEREPDRYAQLDETQRRVAEEEAKRREAEAEQIAAKGRAGNYDPLRDAERRAAEEEMSRAAEREKSAAAPERKSVNELEEFEARSAAKRQELEEKYRLGRITAHDVTYEITKFENQMFVEGKMREQQLGREEPVSSPEQQDRASDNPGQDRPQSGAGRDSASEPHDPPSREEKPDARTVRKARLRAIHDDNERERRENENKGLNKDLNQDRDSGRWSR